MKNLNHPLSIVKNKVYPQPKQFNHNNYYNCYKNKELNNPHLNNNNMFLHHNHNNILFNLNLYTRDLFLLKVQTTNNQVNNNTNQAKNSLLQIRNKLSIMLLTKIKEFLLKCLPIFNNFHKMFNTDIHNNNKEDENNRCFFWDY